MDNTIATENFIDFCDGMMIATEATKKRPHPTVNVKDAKSCGDVKSVFEAMKNGTPLIVTKNKEAIQAANKCIKTNNISNKIQKGAVISTATGLFLLPPTAIAEFCALSALLGIAYVASIISGVGKNYFVRHYNMYVNPRNVNEVFFLKKGYRFAK